MEFNLSIKENAKIEVNCEALKSFVLEKVSTYGNVTNYSDEEIKIAKADRAELNSLKKEIDSKRKAFKKAFLQPYEEIEESIKEVIALIDEPISLIDARIKEKEARDKEEKRKKINAFIESHKLEGIEIPFNESWLNASVSLKKAQNEIAEMIEGIHGDLEILGGVGEFSFEAIDFYKNNGLSLSKALKEVERLKELAEKKKAAEAASQTPTPAPTPAPVSAPIQTPAQAPIQAPVQAPVQSVPMPSAAPHPVSVPTPTVELSLKNKTVSAQENKNWFSLNVYVTTEEAKEIITFLKSKNISFKG